LKPVAPTPRRSKHSTRLVIIEDHELLATSLALALRQRGLEVETVTGLGAEAIIDTVRGLAPILVLLDLDLGPSLGSGLELIRPLIEAGGRVMMMTGMVERARLAACIEAGAVGIVSKTAGFAELVDAIRRAVDGEELMTSSQRQVLLSELEDWRRTDRARLAPFAALTPREQAVLARLVAGESAETIAARSYVSLATIRSQIKSILRKLGVSSQLAAVALAHDAGWPQSSG
jgi:two-component system nitrate/nitrite response regulator NarL